MKKEFKAVSSDKWRVTRGIALLCLSGAILGPGPAAGIDITNPPARPANVKITGAARQANSQVTASTTAGTLIVARATRRGCLIRNLDATISVYIGAATVTSSNGMLLKAGESVVVSGVTLYQVIAASGSPVVAVIDEYD